MSLELCRRFTATTVIFAVIAFVVVSPTWADTNAVFTGKVLESDPPTPMAGVVITLVDPSSEETFSSDETDDDGLVVSIWRGL